MLVLSEFIVLGRRRMGTETLEAAFGKGVLGWKREALPVLESRL